MSAIQNHNFLGDRHTDCTGSCKSNYHMITLEKNRTLCIKNTYMFRVEVIGFIYVMLLLTYMFRVGVIGFIYVMLLLTYMFRVEVIGFIYVMLLLTYV